MTGNLVIKTVPAIEPVTLAEIHSQINVEDAFTADDTLLATLITSARSYLEKLYGIRMIAQEWYYHLDKFPDDNFINLPIGPVTAIASVKYTPNGGTQTTFSATTGYETDLVSLPARIALKDGQSWPTDFLTTVNGICIEFTCGYAALSTLTAARAAMAAAEVLVAAAVTGGEIIAAKAALAAAVIGLAAAEAAEIAAVPEDLKSAVKLLVAHYYRNREAFTPETMKELPMAVSSLMSEYRLWQRET